MTWRFMGSISDQLGKISLLFLQHANACTFTRTCTIHITSHALIGGTLRAFVAAPPEPALEAVAASWVIRSSSDWGVAPAPSVI